MSEERLPCRTEGCERTIQPATAKRNDGYCGPCRSQIDHKERQEYIRKHRKDVDPYEGITDPVEMISILHRKQKYDPLINELPCPRSAEDLYTSLAKEDADRLMAIAADKVVGPESDAAEDIARCLAAFTDHNLDLIRTSYLEQNCVPPPIAFRGASDVFAELLIKRMGGGGRLVNNETLLCLAWIGTPRVVAFFKQTQEELPEWAGSLYVHPSQYTLDAGWEVRDGQRHNLYFDECFAIRKANEDEAIDGTVSLMQSLPEQCQFCDRALVDMLRLESADPRFAFLPETSGIIHVPMCGVCTCFSDPGAYFRQNEHGGWQWDPSNRRPEYLPDPDEDWGEQPWSSARPKITPRQAYHAASPFLPTTYSQIGGLPTWVQDTGYPSCCDCNRTMMFVAQLDNGDFDFAEGTYYAFRCFDCGTCATGYQQT